MNVLSSVILAVQMLSALAMIGLILMQHGKGADMGASFGGGGSSGSLFGASGSANFLSRSTAALATVFFVATLALAYLSNVRPASSGSVLEGAAATVPASSAPAAATGADASVPAAAPAEGAAQIPTK
ncbi:preprotein translocase subunit SecG [Comamonas sp. Y33R10-2]|uniref:preprotein translocase subunit SecG n=1 Tax=Comamonas sp. Y33R10-2 TaxID=2853257 RepID=UPI001C5C8C0A|nr:preprotein translocase subunit SecG [Comamonas sp. Y33R10-2]QXZ10160.1 preprotein translocase subunit SecG [Comamonas sp. Y33R10-2]